MNKTSITAALVLSSLLGTVASAHADDLVFTLKNGTKSTLTRFYTSPQGVDNWEEDVFGRNVLQPGQSVDITIADGRDVCNYDMRFEFSEESDLDTTEDTQDLCEMGEYEITE